MSPKPLPPSRHRAINEEFIYVGNVETHPERQLAILRETFGSDADVWFASTRREWNRQTTALQNASRKAQIRQA